MLNNERKSISKDEMDLYLKELSKELKKEYGRNTEFEIILVGGSAIASQYNFRCTTMDIDALPSHSIKNAAKIISDKYGLSEDWINSDFKKTKSYSPKIRQYSKHYKTFSGILDVRVIKDEYLIAMKMASFRQYKRDMSDIVGILYEMKNKSKEINFDIIKKACADLYEDKNIISEGAYSFVRKILEFPDLELLYKESMERENQAKDIVMQKRKELSDNILQKYVDDIISEGLDKDDFISALSKSRKRTR